MQDARKDLLKGEPMSKPRGVTSRKRPRDKYRLRPDDTIVSSTGETLSRLALVRR